MAERSIYHLTVREVSEISPHLKRVILNGADLSAFPSGFEGGYVKLLLPRDEQPATRPDPSWSLKRSFTVRAFDRESVSLTLDFALHETRGPALIWASGVAVGDAISVIGPGPVKMLDASADWCLLAGDMTALPAIAVNLERLPEDAQGHAVIEVPSERDCVELKAPFNVRIEWIVTPAEVASRLAERVRTIPWRPGSVSAWVACEFSSMKELRRYLTVERGLDRDQFYISSYWKRGATDEEHKAAKAADA